MKYNRKVDGSGLDMQDNVLPLAPSLAVSSHNIASLTTAQDITVNIATTALRVFAKDSAVFLRYKYTGQTSAVTTSIFDEYIPAGQMLDLGLIEKGDRVLTASIMAETATQFIMIQK